MTAAAGLADVLAPALAVAGITVRRGRSQRYESGCVPETRTVWLAADLSPERAAELLLAELAYLAGCDPGRDGGATGVRSSRHDRTRRRTRLHVLPGGAERDAAGPTERGRLAVVPDGRRGRTALSAP